MKRTGLLLLLLCAQAYALNQSFCPAWKLLSPVQAKCPLFRNGTSNLEAIIEQELAGQELATRAIRKALAKMFREYDEAVLNVGVKEMVMAFPYSLDIMLTNPIAQKTVGDIGTKPLFMHFSGPTGVGKSLCTDIIARAMFSGVNAEHRRCGHLYIMLTEFAAATDRDFPEIQKKLNATIVSQLHHCPRSLLVFDEIQNIPEDLLDALLEIFYGRNSIVASQAVLIMVSDLGHNKLAPGMTRPEATQAIQAAAEKSFLRVNKHVLLDNIVPFLPLAREDLQQVAELELRKLQRSLAKEYLGLWNGKLTWKKQVTEWIAGSCMTDGTYAADGGRGVRTYINHHVFALAEQELLSECAKESGLSYNNVDLRLHASGGPLIAFIDTVVGHDEF